jgi:hypothetical protein
MQCVLAKLSYGNISLANKALVIIKKSKQKKLVNLLMGLVNPLMGLVNLLMGLNIAINIYLIL